MREHWQFALPEPALAARAKEITERNHCVAWPAATLAGQRYIPRLAGQHKDYLLEQLNGFKASKRADHDATMTSAGQGLTADELAPLADY